MLGAGWIAAWCACGQVVGDKGKKGLWPLERKVFGDVCTTVFCSAVRKLSLVRNAAPFLCSVLALTCFNVTAGSGDI